MVRTISWKSEFLSLSRRFGERPAIVDREGTTTYAELFARVAGVGKAVREAGVPHGHPVATLVPNGSHAVAASLGVTLSGAAEARLNPALSADDLRHCMTTAGIRMVITNATLAPLVRSLGARVIELASIQAVDLAACDFPAVAEADWGVLNFTSGTTGKPKGIVHTQAGRWMANILLRAVLPVTPSGSDNLLLVTPYSHGAGAMTHAYLDSGACVTLLPGVVAAEVLSLIETRKITQIFAPPTVLAKLLSEADGRQLNGLKTVFTGTSPLSGQLYRRAKRAFGPIIRVTYGKSEIWNPITVLAPAEADAWYGEAGEPETVCVGWPASGVELSISPLEAADHSGAGSDSMGVVQIRAKHMAIGTLADGRFTGEADNGFHSTGDLGLIDDRGRLHLCGRVADIMKTGGYRVNPEEVEVPLRDAVAPAEITIVGLPSSYWGEIITAVVVGPTPPGLAHAITQLTSYKRPRLVAELDEIPRNAIGKVERRKARDIILEHYILEDGPYPRLTRRSRQAK